MIRKKTEQNQEKKEDETNRQTNIKNDDKEQKKVSYMFK